MWLTYGVDIPTNLGQILNFYKSKMPHVTHLAEQKALLEWAFHKRYSVDWYNTTFSMAWTNILGYNTLNELIKIQKLIDIFNQPNVLANIQELTYI